MNYHTPSELARKIGGSLEGFPSLPPNAHPLQKIVVTGATGWFGRHLVRALLRQTQAELFLLHRSPVQSEVLWKTPALKHEAIQQNWSERIHWINVGDLGFLPAFPIMHFDTLIHSAADLSLAKNVEDLWVSNTLSTRNLWDWARKSGCQHFHHISTLSVWVSSLFSGATCMEEQALESSELLFGGYAASKWSSEAFLRLQMPSSAMKTTVHRLGLLTFSNEEGWNGLDPVWSTIEAWKTWGRPSFLGFEEEDSRAAFDWTPVCECAEKLTQAVVLGGRGAFHWASQSPILAKDWFALLDTHSASNALQSWPKNNPIGKTATRALDRWAYPEKWTQRWWMDLFQTDRHRFSIQRAENLVGPLWNPSKLQEVEYLKHLGILSNPLKQGYNAN